MSWPEIIAYAAVLFVGVPSMLRNWTAVALVGSFILVEGVWAITGGASTLLAVLCDYAVVAAVFLKVDARDCSPFTGLWQNCRLCWGGLSACDKGVLALFAPAWAAYSMTGPVSYWIAWACGVSQIILAGVEAFSEWRKDRPASKGWPARRGQPLPFSFAPAMVP